MAAPDLRTVLDTRWQALGGALALPHDQQARWEAEGRRLLRSWSRWPRRYHDLHHLNACLGHLDGVRDRLAEPAAVELALWYHDAIYWPWSAHNETRSAEWAGRFLGTLPLRPGQADTVVRLVLETRHLAPPSAGDAQWLIDIDLAILGQPEPVYRAFERNVRAEYRFIPWRRWTERRARVLGSFLARERIYATDWFHGRWEAQARINLAAAIASLQRGELYGPLPS